MLSTRIFSNILEITEEWNKLLQNSETATVFQTPQYLSAWCESFIKDQGEIFIIAIYDEEKLIGVAPFRRIGSKITLLGTDRVGEKGDLVTDFGDIIAIKGQESIIWNEVIITAKEKGITEIELDFVREFSQSYKILAEKYQTMQMTDNGVFEVSPFLDLPKTYEEYLSCLSRKNRHELKRKFNRLEETGFKIINSQKPGDDIEEFIRLHKASTEEKDKFMSEEMAGFFRKVVNNLVVRNCVDIVFMIINGVKVSSTISFLCHDEYWLYNSGFDRNFDYQAVGLLLKAYTIKMAIEKGYTKYNFLRGNERYKYDLGARDERLYKITIKYYE